MVDPARRRDRRRRPAGPTSPTDVEALAPAGPAQVWVGDIGDNPRAARVRSQVAAGAGRPRRPDGRRRRRTTWSTRTAPHDAETLLADPRDRPAARGHARTSSAARSTPRRATLVRDRAQPAARGRRRAADRDRRRVLPRRQALRRARLRAARPSTRSPGSSRSATFRLPAQQQGEGHRGRRPTTGCYVSTRGRSSATVLRVPLPRRAIVAGDRRASPDADTDAARGRRAAETAGPQPVAVAVAPAAGRSGRGCSAALRPVARRLSLVRRLATRPAWSGFVGPRPTSPAGPGAGPGAGFVYLDEHGDRLPDDGRPAGARPGDPAGLDGRLGHAVRQRAPAGGRHRRRRSAAVPLPPGLADPAGRGEVRPDAGVRQGADPGPRAGASPTSAARGCRWSARARSPYGCWTWATSGSATTSTPTRTAASG